MNKKSALLLLCLVPAIAFSQVSASMKAHLLFPTDSGKWSDVSSTATNAYTTQGKDKMGFNVGLSVKVKLMKILFIMPEVYYTSIEETFKEPLSQTTLRAQTNRVDIPVLVGLNMLGDNFAIFGGPVASYNLAKENKYEDFRENAESGFTAGYQFGAEIRIRKLILSGRYEGAVSEKHRYYINDISNRTIRYDNRGSMFLAGIGYKF